MGFIIFFNGMLVTTKSRNKYCIIGLGYVGLPLLNVSSMHFDVVGYDKNPKRISLLNNLVDSNNQINQNDLKIIKKKNIISSNPKILKNANIFIITVPTPVNVKNQPDLTLIKDAFLLISKYLRKGHLVILESTVYPGLTEELSKKILQKKTGLKFNIDFHIGYSPERINPGDNKRGLSNVTKVISSSNKKSLKTMYNFYSKFINKIHIAETVEIAEASKIIENIQRDLNIALINELTMIFKKMNIPISKILKAARTKWNFLDFRPGLVGGHCIGVDPYYLAFKAKKLSVNSDLILAGRKINNQMVDFLFEDISLSIRKAKLGLNSKILFMGLTFKENCPDFRNSKNLELFCKIQKKFINSKAYDPYMTSYIKSKFSINTEKKLINIDKYEFIILALAHDEFKNINLKENFLIYDIKNFFKSANFYL